MSVLIGHASIDENGNAAYGSAGDQTKKEVCTRNWYLKSWDVVLRPIDSAMAEKMAKACEAACANDNIGYDQSQRNTLHKEALKVGYDLSKITTGCECDCSSLMCVCAIAGGAPADKLYIGGNMGTTRTIRNYFKNTGMFQILTDSKYLDSDNYLRRGDVIVNEGSHTMMALSNGSKSGVNIKPIKPTDSKVIGIAISRGNINIRTGPATSYEAVGIAGESEQLQVLEITANNWYKILYPAASEGYAYVSNSGGKYFDYVSVSANSNNPTTEAKPVISNKIKPYRIKVTVPTLIIRKGPGPNHDEKGFIRKDRIFTIVDEYPDDEGKIWGLLDEFATTDDGWINLSYTQKI